MRRSSSTRHAACNKKASTTGRAAWVVFITGAFVLGGLGAALPRSTPAQARTAHQGLCSTLGTYTIAQPAERGTPGVPPARSRPGPGGVPITPVWLLRGQLVLAAYTGCGGTTSGTFAAQLGVVGGPPRSPAPRTALCATPCGPPPAVLPSTAISRITGSFVQDPAHAADPLYTRVSATITSTRPGPPPGRPCARQTGCPLPSVITSTMAITAVTGYLQVATIPPGVQMANCHSCSLL
jgi:hypothetical protein